MTRRFFLHELSSCSVSLNPPPIKALLLFEKPHVRATPSRFVHSAPKQGASRTSSISESHYWFRAWIIVEQPPHCKNFVC